MAKNKALHPQVRKVEQGEVKTMPGADPIDSTQREAEELARDDDAEEWRVESEDGKPGEPTRRLKIEEYRDWVQDRVAKRMLLQFAGIASICTGVLGLIVKFYGDKFVAAVPSQVAHEVREEMRVAKEELDSKLPEQVKAGVGTLLVDKDKLLAQINEEAYELVLQKARESAERAATEKLNGTVLPEIRKRLEDDVRNRVQAEVGTELSSKIEAALADEDLDGRVNRALGDLSKRMLDPEKLEALVQQIVRDEAVPQYVHDTLAQRYKSLGTDARNAADRESVVRSLAMFSKDAKLARPFLLEVAERDDAANVRAAAFNGLDTLAPLVTAPTDDAKQILDALERQFSRMSSSELRRYGFSSSARVHPGSAALAALGTQAISKFTEALRESTSTRWNDAYGCLLIDALARIGGDSVLNEFESLLGQKKTRRMALVGLASINATAVSDRLRHNVLQRLLSDESVTHVTVRRVERDEDDDLLTRDLDNEEDFAYIRAPDGLNVCDLILVHDSDSEGNGVTATLAGLLQIKDWEWMQREPDLIADESQAKTWITLYAWAQELARDETDEQVRNTLADGALGWLEKYTAWTADPHAAAAIARILDASSEKVARTVLQKLPSACETTLAEKRVARHECLAAVIGAAVRRADPAKPVREFERMCADCLPCDEKKTALIEALASLAQAEKWPVSDALRTACAGYGRNSPVAAARGHAIEDVFALLTRTADEDSAAEVAEVILGRVAELDGVKLDVIDIDDPRA